MQQTNLFEDQEWLRREDREARVAQALAQGDVATLEQGFQVFLRMFGHPPTSREVWTRAFVDFLSWLWLWEGRHGLDLEPGDVERWYADLATHGRHRLEGKEQRRPLASGSLRSWLHGLRRAVGFLDWAGQPWPEEVRWPGLHRDRSGQQPPITHEEFARLLKAAEAHPKPERALRRALLYLMGDAGLLQTELEYARVEDFTGKRLGVRRSPYYVQRRIDLSPDAREALEEWMEVRDKLRVDPQEDALLVSVKRRVALKQYAIALRLRQMFDEAGVSKGRRLASRRLRSRARELAWQRLGDREKVAEYLGIQHPEEPVWQL